MSATDYISKAGVLVEEFTLAGRHMTLEEQNLYVLQGLRPEFRGFMSSLNVRCQPITLQELADILGSEEFMTCGGPGGGSPAAFTTQKGGQKGRGSGCSNGGRGSGQNNGQNSGQTGQPRGGGGGHGRGGGRRGGRRNGNWQPKCQLCHVLGHTASTCHLWCAMDPQANVIYQETPSDPQGSHTWLPDTGATNHTTPDIDVLSF
ncbi:PREDICTED: glycine-rich protein DC9.1-like [Ipomoea nil]|uniref:glycine-rich protein DC9.1-like n=1 Tax=Ipomoea nil TaxID=35883 RepID=UPI000901FB73|nr:PREDICTED: glycine-rich protein DC9.1-like [Ipomoea nil]